MDFLGIELFLDDEMIAYTRNVRRDICQPLKHENNPIITSEYPWESRHVTVYGSVLPDKERGVLRMWYNAYGDSYFNEQNLAYAESEDGIHWTKPMMDYISWGDHEKTNLLMGPDPNLHGPCVIENPDRSDPNRRFLMLFDSYDDYHPEVKGKPGMRRAVYACESPDGFKWSPEKGRLAFSGKADSGQCVIWEPRKQKFLTYARLTAQDAYGQRLRIFRFIESPDFVHWETQEELFRPDDFDGTPDRQLQQIAVTRFDGIYVGLLGIFQAKQYIEDGTSIDEGDQLDDIQLMTSRDGEHFSRVAERAVFLPKSEPPLWGTGGQRMASQMVLHNDTLHLYYGSQAQDANGKSYGGLKIGLATLPRDRFVAMVPARLREEALIELVPLVYPNDQLRLNIQILPGGSVRAEVADFVGQTIEGFDKDSSVPITESGLDQPIQWQKDGATMTLDGLTKEQRRQPVRLRLWICHAHVHAIRSS